MPMVQAFWNKLNPNEKMVMYGAGAVVIAFLLGLVGAGRYYGLAGGYTGDLIAAVVIGVLYWLKYSPNQINWPAPVQTIVLVIAGISAFFAILGALAWFGLFAFDLYALASILNAVGCAVMAYFAWKEYQTLPKTAPPAPPAPPAA